MSWRRGRGARGGGKTHANSCGKVPSQHAKSRAREAKQAAPYAWLAFPAATRTIHVWNTGVGGLNGAWGGWGRRRAALRPVARPVAGYTGGRLGDARRLWSLCLVTGNFYAEILYEIRVERAMVKHLFMW